MLFQFLIWAQLHECIYFVIIHREVHQQFVHFSELYFNKRLFERKLELQFCIHNINTVEFRGIEFRGTFSRTF